MSENKEPYSDPLIDEVRQRRRDLFEELGCDLKRLGELIQKRQARHPEKLVDRRKNQSRNP